MREMIDILAAACTEAGILLAEDQYQQLEGYAEAMVERNRVMNLTAITDPEGVAIKHLFDCIQVLDKLAIPEGARVIDVGTGAGFPGIPFAILRPDLEVHLLDSTAKKLRFIEEAAAACGIRNITLHHARAESAGHEPALRERFDLAAARAVAATGVLSELMLPLVRPGGRMAALKGPGLAEELEPARPLIATLGGGAPQVESYTLPNGEARTLLTIPKASATPKKYPRAPGKTGR